MSTKKIEKPFSAYGGSEPYVFISYAHLDSEKVYSYINQMHEKDGIRIWYDEGIEPGEDWLEKIFVRLKNAAYVICFMSKTAADSKYVRGEVQKAVSIGKKVLVVYLERTDIKELSLILNADQGINRAADLDDTQIYAELVKHANNSGHDVFDYSKITKPFLLNGHSVPVPYLARNQEHRKLESFIVRDNENKILTLVAHSGTGKSTFLIQHIKNHYSWQNYGNTVYFSFENQPYLGSFLKAFLSKILEEGMAEMSQEAMTQKVLSYLSARKCTIFFDAVEQLFRGYNDKQELVLQDSAFLLFINKLLLGSAKIILSSKVQLPLFSEYSQKGELVFSGITLSDFEVFLRESGIENDLHENEKQKALNEILAATNNNIAVICLLINYIKSYCGASISKTLNSQFFSLKTDVALNENLFDFYWDNFTEQEKSLLEALALMRGEVTIEEIQMLATWLRCHKLAVMQKLDTFLLINKNNASGVELFSLHNVFKSAIKARIPSDETFKKLHLLISRLFNADDSNLFRCAEHCWHLLNANEIDDANDILLQSERGVACLIDKLYYLGAYSVVIDLLDLSISEIDSQNGLYATANRKIAMSIDKSGRPKGSLKYFDAYIKASRTANDSSNLIKGLYYKSEPVYCIGDFSRSLQILNEAAESALAANIHSSKVKTNLSGRKALVTLAQADFITAQTLAQEALNIILDEDYREADRETLECWWNLVFGKTQINANRKLAIEHIERALLCAEKFTDFRSECLYELARIYLLENDFKRSSEFYKQAIEEVGDNIFVYTKLQLLHAFYHLILEDVNEAKDVLTSASIIVTNSEYGYLKAVYNLLCLQTDIQKNKFDYINNIKEAEHLTAINSMTKKYLNSMVVVNELLRKTKNFVGESLNDLLEVFICG